MSPVCSQPVGVDRLRGLVGHVAVALHDLRAADQDLAVVGQLQLHVRSHLADRPELDRVGQVHGAAAAALGQAPQLRHRHADRVEELEHRHRSRCRAHVHGLELVEAELLAQLRQHHLVGLRVLLRELVGHLLAGLLQPHLLVADVDRPLQRALALRVLLALDHRVEAGLQLLPDAGHREEPAGPHLGQVGDHLARVRAAGDASGRARSVCSGRSRARRCAPWAGRRRPARPRGSRSRPRSRAPRS